MSSSIIKLHVIKVNDKMQSDYKYTLTEKEGKNMKFEPYYSPKEMLKMGVFEGHYMTDCKDEFPKSWYKDAKMDEKKSNIELNYFGIKSRQNLDVWQEKGWIYGDDPRGWFQWYCRYYLGRRDPEVDEIQIKRFNAMKRHSAQILKRCKHIKVKGHCSDPLNCQPKHRQTLLQWSYDALI